MDVGLVVGAEEGFQRSTGREEENENAETCEETERENHKDKKCQEVIDIILCTFTVLLCGISKGAIL